MFSRRRVKIPRIIFVFIFLYLEITVLFIIAGGPLLQFPYLKLVVICEILYIVNEIARGLYLVDLCELCSLYRLIRLIILAVIEICKTADIISVVSPIEVLEKRVLDKLLEGVSYSLFRIFCQKISDEFSKILWCFKILGLWHYLLILKVKKKLFLVEVLEGEFSVKHDVYEYA